MKELIVRLCVAALFVGLAAGCSGDSNVAEWREEVKLSDGRLISIVQKRRYKVAYAGGPLKGSEIVRESWIRLQLPEFGSGEIEWHENLIPMRLDFWKQSLIIVGYPPTGFEFDKYGKPVPAYVGFKYENGKWLRLKFEEIPREIYDANLVIQRRLPSGMMFLPLSEKEGVRFNKSLDVARVYKTIVSDFGKGW